MRKRIDARTALYERIRNTAPKFVHVTGVPYTVEVDNAAESGEPDRIWMTMEVPPFGRLRATLNTTSWASKKSGYDPHLCVAIMPGRWEEKPQTGLVESEGQSYASLEAIQPLKYEQYEQAALSELLLARIKEAIRAEVWGDLYAKDHLGVHQIHSRRASRAVPKDEIGRDGALKLYYPTENRTESFFFKFDGQS